MGSVLRSYGNMLNPGKLQVPTGQLTIDWTHPLARGLVGCWVPGVMGGVDITGYSSVTLTDGSPHSSIYNATEEGPGYFVNASGVGLLDAAGSDNTNIYTGWTEFSGYSRGWSKGAAGGFGGHYIAGSTVNVFGMATTSAGTTYNLWLNTTTVTSGVARPAANVKESFGWTTKVGGSSILYVNGVSVFTGAAGTSPSADATINNNISTLMNTVTNFIAYWNRALRADEMAQLDIDPYGFLIPAEAEMPTAFLAAAAPALQLMGQAML